MTATVPGAGHLPILTDGRRRGTRRRRRRRRRSCRRRRGAAWCRRRRVDRVGRARERASRRGPTRRPPPRRLGAAADGAAPSAPTTPTQAPSGHSFRRVGSNGALSGLCVVHVLAVGIMDRSTAGGSSVSFGGAGSSRCSSSMTRSICAPSAASSALSCFSGVRGRKTRLRIAVDGESLRSVRGTSIAKAPSRRQPSMPGWLSVEVSTATSPTSPRVRSMARRTRARRGRARRASRPCG